MSGATKIRFPLKRYPLDDGSLWPPVPYEGIWAEEIGGYEYRVNNIPFYATGVSYNDVVTAKRSIDGELQFQSVTHRGGHHTFRVLLRNNIRANDFRVVELIEAIRRLGITYESADGNTLYALDFPPDTDIPAAYGLVLLGWEESLWDIEEGNYDGPRTEENLPS